MAAKCLGLDALGKTYVALQGSSDEPICERLLRELRVDYRVPDRDLQHIPTKGPVVLVANHPYGVLDGAVLATILKKIRPDVRFLANGVLAAIPEIQDLLIGVDILGQSNGTTRNSSALRKCIEFVTNGGCLIVFPAGEVSHFQVRKFAVADGAWVAGIARMIAAVARSGVALSIVPVHVEGSNSVLFQTAGVVHSRLRTLLLARELLNKKQTVVKLRFGSAIDSQKLLDIPTNAERMDYLRWRSDLLARRAAYKPNLKRPFLRRRRSEAERIAEAVDAQACSAEISSLPAEDLLLTSGDFRVYIASSARIPQVLREIGRLRELTFRAAGEGTGKSIDQDEFDSLYLHLFLWNDARREIVGAYRIAQTDTIRRRRGVKGLYTATLFEYGEVFLDKMGPALELGRSFVRTEYQRSFSALLLLWKGIGKFLARNPRYRILFGPVSISNEYEAVSRNLMLKFLEKRAWLSEWAGFVSSRTPIKPGRNSEVHIPTGFDLDDLSGTVTDLEQGRAGIPVLLRQYLRLGGRLLGFNLDASFNNAVDGLIVVDLTKTDRKLLERYLGKAEATEFLQWNSGGNTAASLMDCVGEPQRRPC